MPFRGTNPATCGCYLRRTHGLPCACVLNYYSYNAAPIPLECVDQYWRTLDIEFPSYHHESSDDESGNDNEDDVPPTANIVAPPIKHKSKKTTILKGLRVPSGWEMIMRGLGLKKDKQKKGKGRVAGIRDTQAGTSGGSPMSLSPAKSSPGSPMSPLGTPTSRPPKSPASNLGQRRRQRQQTRFPLIFSVYEEEFPPYIRDYITHVTNVKGDGNCGYRVVALAIYGSEDDWERVRHEMSANIQLHRRLYRKILQGHPSTTRLLRMVDYYNDTGDMHRAYWMALPECGHVVATTYNVVFRSFSNAGGYTFLPAILEPGMQQPTQTVVAGNVHGNHFVMLHMTPNDYPCTPVALYWGQHHDQSVHGLDIQFQARINEYNRLWNADGPRRTAELAKKRNK